MSVREVVKKLRSNVQSGISKEEVKKRVKLYGHNKLPDEPRESWIKVFIRQFKSPLIYLRNKFTKT